jgi:hypothetical protein
MSLENLLDTTRAGQRCPKPLATSKQSNCGGKEINVLVLGKQSSGKTGQFNFSLSDIPGLLRIEIEIKYIF